MDQTTMNGMPNMAPAKKSNSMVLIVVILIILAVFLVTNMMQNKKSDALDTEIMQKQAEIKASDLQAQALNAQSESDTTADIEKDLNATNVESITLE